MILVGVLCGLAYFYFSKEHTGVFGGAATIGIWVLMVGFGASFGYTVMARISLFIQRVQFLGDWWNIAVLEGVAPPAMPIACGWIRRNSMPARNFISPQAI